MRILVIPALLALSCFAQAASTTPPKSAVPSVPRKAKELTIMEPGGKQTLLSAYKGKVVVLQFLFTYCPHCQAFSTLLTKLQGEYGARGFQPLGGAIHEEDTLEKVAVYTSQFAKFPVGLVPRDAMMNFMQFPVDARLAVPILAVIDRKGVVRAQSPSTGANQLQKEACLRPLLETLLKETAQTPTTTLPAAVKSVCTEKEEK